MKISGIYKIQSILKPERIYIGSAIRIDFRWNLHLHKLRNNKHHSKKLQRHYNKYGESDLCISVLFRCEKCDLIKKEQYYIDLYNPYFNNAKIAGSCRGTKRTDECRLRISQRIISSETRQKMSISHKGKKMSLESRIKMARSKKGNTAWLGKKHSEETKMKLREKQKGIKPSDEAKRKNSEAHKGKIVSLETKMKMSQSHHKRWNNLRILRVDNLLN